MSHHASLFVTFKLIIATGNTLIDASSADNLSYWGGLIKKVSYLNRNGHYLNFKKVKPDGV